MSIDISKMTPKQQQKLMNRLKNEEQRLSKIAKKSKAVAAQPSGLSAGQRRRKNRAMKKASVPNYGPAPLPPASSSSSFGMRAFPSGRISKGSGPKTIPVTEDEFIANVKGSILFKSESYYLNPGQSATFPWLSTIAKQFEKYRTRYCEFYYKPTVSGFATNGQTGKVMLSFDYDASDPPPASKIQVEDTHPHEDCMPYEEMCISLDPRQLNSQDSKYIRPAGLPASSDIKTYDGGLLTISTQGQVDGTDIGELRVRYSFDLLIPVLESTTTTPQNFHVSRFTFDNPSESAPGVLVPWVVDTNPLGIEVTATYLVLPPGNYLVSCYSTITDPDSTATIENFELNVGPAGGLRTYGAVKNNASSFQLSASGTDYFTSSGTGLQLQTFLGFTAVPSESVQAVMIIQSV